MQLYYLSQRKDSSIWYVALRDPVSGNVGTKKSTGTSVRREAETIAQLWLRDGMPRTSKESYETFVDFLDHFWDFDNSKHFREMVTMGKNVTRRHANDMRNVVRRYYKPYWGRNALVYNLFCKLG
jgi:hypothetical protein